MENITSAEMKAPHGKSVPARSSLGTGTDPSIPTSTCGFHTLPDEVLLSIFRKLATVKDVCSCILVCGKWEELIGGDEIWVGLLAQRFGKQEYARGGARVEFKRCTMVQAIGGRFQVLKKGFEYLAAAMDAWWASGAPSDATLPYNQATVRRIIGKLTASNWALLYEGFGALFIARADKLALDLFASAQSPDATPPKDLPTSPQGRPNEKPFLSPPSHPPFSSRRHSPTSPSLLNPKFSPASLNPTPSPESFKPAVARRTNQQVTAQRSPKPTRNVELTSGSFSDDLLEAFGRGPAKRPKTGYGLSSAQGVPISELVARAESEPEGRGWGRGLRGLAEAGVNPDDVAEALASGELYNSVDSTFETASWGTGGLETGSISSGVSQLEGSLGGGKTGDKDGLDTGTGPFLWLDRGGIEAETIYGGQGKPPLSPERRQSGTQTQSVAQGRVRNLHRRPKAGEVGAALWRGVLRVWRRHRAFVLLVSEQCESLNIEVLRERARAHAVAATPTVFDQGALCFRGQILLRHKIRRPLQAGLAWLTMRAISGDATDEEYELLKDIRHMRQEIDVRDDFTLTKATFTQAKFRRCFCNI